LPARLSDAEDQAESGTDAVPGNEDRFSPLKQQKIDGPDKQSWESVESPVLPKKELEIEGLFRLPVYT
jgi:hypothetical protein